METLKAFFQSIKEFFVKYNVFIWVVGGLILVAKYRDILISLLAKESKVEFDAATKKDTVLAKQEENLNTQSDALKDKANQEAAPTTDVSEDWNTK